MPNRYGLVVAAALALTAPAFAETRTVPVHFAAGKTSIVLKEKITGRQSISYTLGAEAGQTMRLRLVAPNGAVSFNLYQPGRKPGDEALAIGEMSGQRFEAALPQSGVYTIDVFLNRAAARRRESGAFVLNVSVEPKTDVSTPVKADHADGLQGGPDFWRVTGGATALRDGASLAGRIRARLAANAVLKNEGCRMAEGARWCKVTTVTDPQQTGWVRGDRLRESAAPPDARVAGTAFHATGTLPCAVSQGQPTAACRFGVVRRGQGEAVVTVFLPGEGQRLIRFRKGKPAGSDAPGGARLTFTQEGDLYIVRIGTERFEIVDAAVNGG